MDLSSYQLCVCQTPFVVSTDTSATNALADVEGWFQRKHCAWFGIRQLKVWGAKVKNLALIPVTLQLSCFW